MGVWAALKDQRNGQLTGPRDLMFELAPGVYQSGRARSGKAKTWTAWLQTPCSHPHGMPTRCDLCPGGSTEPRTAHQLRSLSPSASVLCRLLPVCQGETLPLRMLRTWGVPRTHRFHPWSWQQRSGFCSVLQGPSAPCPAPPSAHSNKVFSCPQTQSPEFNVTGLSKWKDWNLPLDRFNSETRAMLLSY